MECNAAHIHQQIDNSSDDRDVSSEYGLAQKNTDEVKTPIMHLTAKDSSPMEDSRKSKNGMGDRY